MNLTANLLYPLWLFMVCQSWCIMCIIWEPVGLRKRFGLWSLTGIKRRVRCDRQNSRISFCPAVKWGVMKPVGWRGRQTEVDVFEYLSRLLNGGDMIEIQGYTSQENVHAERIHTFSECWKKLNWIKGLNDNVFLYTSNFLRNTVM